MRTWHKWGSTLMLGAALGTVQAQILVGQTAGFSGVVGAGVQDLSPGDHVVAAFVPCCGACEPCTSGRPALCEPGLAANTAGTLLRGGRRLHRGGSGIHHHLGVSAFAQHATMARESWSTIPMRPRC